jgi:cytochrome c556
MKSAAVLSNARTDQEGRNSMLRIIWVLAAIALGVTAVTAQSDPIAARQELMKANGRQAKLGSNMAKGEAPFDVAKAKEIFATFMDAANKMPNLFPENSKTGGETAAAPEIWQHMDDVKARFGKFAADSKAAQESVTDLDSFKAAFRTVGQNCQECHERYRLKKS